MDSKFTLLCQIPLILITLNNRATCYEQPKAISLKGGLIYESVHKPIQVNSNYMTFHRQLNISLVSNSVKLCDEYISRYTNLCSQLQNYTKSLDIPAEQAPTQYFVTQKKVAFEEALSICKSHNSILPEPRTYNELIELNRIMSSHSIIDIPIGIYYNVPNNRFQYMSDNADVITVGLFPYIMYKEGSNEKTQGPFHKNQKVKDQAVNNLIYAYKHHNILEIAIPPYEKKIPLVQTPTFVICQYLPKQEDPKKSILMTIANLHCLQSVPDLTSTNILLQQELSIFTSVLSQTPAEMASRDSNNRTKRFAPSLVLPSLIGSTVTANAITSTVSGAAPLSWFGDLLSKVFGFSTERSMNEMATVVNQQTTKINTLTINQNELATAFQALTSQLRKFSEFVTATDYTASYLFNLIDNRFAINKLQNTIQFSFLKIADALSAAMTHSTSPYILSEKELQTISHSYKGFNIHLSEDISQVHTSAFLYNNSIYFTFQIPIIEEKLFFHLYQVTPVPIFTNQTSHIPELDAKYIALSVTENYYSILNDFEYNNCITSTHCTISDIQRPNDKSAHCVIASYFTDTPMCPLVNYTLENSFFKIYGNQLIYSTNSTLPIHLRCPQRNAVTFNPIVVNLSGMGKAQIADGCSVTLQNNKRFSTLSKIKKVELSTSPFMNIISQNPNISTLQFKPITYDHVSIPIIHFHNHSDFEIPDIWQRLRKPSENALHLIRTILVFIILSTLLSFLCICSPKIRTWFKTCIFWKNPRTWWTTYKKYEIPTFRKRSEVEAEKEIEERVNRLSHSRRHSIVFTRPPTISNNCNTLPHNMNLMNPSYPRFRDVLYPTLPNPIYEQMHLSPTVVMHKNDIERDDEPIYAKPSISRNPAF